PGSAPFAGRIAAQGVRVVPVSRRRALPNGAGLAGEMLVLETASGRVDLVARDDLGIRGDHNVSNALAAAAAAHLFGADIEAIREGLRTFQPIEHRLEPAGEVDGVEYFNDSKATNPDAVVKALTAFPERDIVLLLGGRNKGNDFADLAAEVCARCKAVVTFGEAGSQIGVALEAVGCPGVAEHSLADAVSTARGLAEPADVVLLSPACASFDEFDDYADRGRAFKRLVAGLAKEVALGGA
ncbi:MAG: UDP-N-acetylmuramoyl-L-alanine--D-glutamate ligase, partial [Coriobacteriia bacterium]|nr:UDP-N-acetylmuramoyl-L-alanine--D-glutamate ligase [Coriobacteriia bacterium]